MRILLYSIPDRPHALQKSRDLISFMEAMQGIIGMETNREVFKGLTV